MNYITVIGLIAAVFTTSSLIPQMVQIHRTKETRDLSLIMLVMFATGIFLWLVYGVLTNALPIMLANSIAFASSIYIIVMKIRHG